MRFPQTTTSFEWTIARPTHSTPHTRPAQDTMAGTRKQTQRPRTPISATDKERSAVGTHETARGAKIIPHLWYNDNAVEAAKFYASVFPESRIDDVSALQADSPSGGAGSVDIVEFTLFRQPLMAISAGLECKFNPSISFIVNFDPLFFGASTSQKEDARKSSMRRGKNFRPAARFSCRSENPTVHPSHLQTQHFHHRSPREPASLEAAGRSCTDIRGISCGTPDCAA